VTDIALIDYQENNVVITAESIAEEMPSMPLPPDTRTFFTGGIFVILLLGALNYASAIAIPIVLAFVMKLVLQPVFRILTNVGIPRSLASSLIIMALVFGTAGFLTVLSTPAASWADKLQEGYPQLREKFSFLSESASKTQKILVQAEDLTKSVHGKVMSVAMAGTSLPDRILIGTQTFMMGIFTTMIVLFFLLTADDTFLRRLVEVLPRFKDKRQAVNISQQIESDVSKYLATITIINVCVGVIAGCIMKFFHIEDPMLWGTLAFLLNYIPIIGPLVVAAIFALVGIISIPDISTALLPAALYMGVHIIEGTAVTPLLVARRFTLNPVLVILALVFWYWMWGIPGAILAMPMLAITKVICDRIHKLSAFGHFLGSSPTT